jgi:hypothetical protein
VDLQRSTLRLCPDRLALTLFYRPPRSVEDIGGHVGGGGGGVPLVQCVFAPPCANQTASTTQAAGRQQIGKCIADDGLGDLNIMLGRRLPLQLRLRLLATTRLARLVRAEVRAKNFGALLARISLECAKPRVESPRGEDGPGDTRLHSDHRADEPMPIEQTNRFTGAR